jgi:hypothetical protein
MANEDHAMSALIWLDVPLSVFGLLSMSPFLWHCFRRRRLVCLPSRGRGRAMAMALLFSLGFVSLTTASVDVALAEWDKACRPRSDDWIGETMPAPDFCLPSLEKDRFVRLSDYRGHKPVVLIFGSFG